MRRTHRAHASLAALLKHQHRHGFVLSSARKRGLQGRQRSRTQTTPQSNLRSRPQWKNTTTRPSTFRRSRGRKVQLPSPPRSARRSWPASTARSTKSIHEDLRPLDQSPNRACTRECGQSAMQPEQCNLNGRPSGGTDRRHCWNAGWSAYSCATRRTLTPLYLWRA